MTKKDYIEPKVWFANERTLLNWVRTSVLIATLGLALMNLAPNTRSARWAKLAGVLLVPMSIGFIGQSIHSFFWRNKMLRNKDPGPYSLTWSPLLLSSVFIVALLANYVILLVEDAKERS